MDPSTPSHEVPPGFHGVTIDEIIQILQTNRDKIDTFCILAYAKTEEKLVNPFAGPENPKEPAEVPCFSMLRLGSVERGADQFDDFVRIHMQAAPAVIQLSQARTAQRIQAAHVLVSPEGAPLLGRSH